MTNENLRAKLDALVLGELTEEERANSVVYLDEQLRPPGQSSMAGQELVHDGAYLVVFVDQQPGVNWMHRCRYLLIDSVTGKITSINSDRPPLFGALPPTWRVVWQSHGLENWRLLPLLRPPSQGAQ